MQHIGWTRAAGTREKSGRLALAIAATAALAACGGGHSGSDNQPPAGMGVTIGGQVSGLGTGKSLALLNNGQDELSIGVNGGFFFQTRLTAGSAYAVIVKTQPAGQRCTVSQGSGVATASVGDVAVRCETLAAATYTVGGTVAGLASGVNVVLQNNARDDLAVGTNGGFTFPTALAGGSAYAVTVKTQPAGQSCAVRNGAGTVASANVGTVDVSCATALALPQGDWRKDTCVAVSNGFVAEVWRITSEGTSRAAATSDLSLYANADCTAYQGPGPGFPFSLGTFVFSSNAATSTMTAFRGQWNQPTGDVTPVIWALKSGRLCVVADSAPTSFPDLAGIERYIDNAIQARTCYRKL